jgi:hypothetical protein
MAFVPVDDGAVHEMVTVPDDAIAEILAGALGATPLLGARKSNRLGEPMVSVILFCVAPLTTACDTCDTE